VVLISTTPELALLALAGRLARSISKGMDDMNFKTTLIGAAALAALTLPVHAEYTVKGSVECPGIVEEDANEHFRQYNRWWVLGYITGRNYAAEKDVGKGMDNDKIYEIALDFCKNNPNNDWDDASRHVYDLLD
jgi:hypothetical protein